MTITQLWIPLLRSSANWRKNYERKPTQKNFVLEYCFIVQENTACNLNWELQYLQTVF